MSRYDGAITVFSPDGHLLVRPSSAIPLDPRPSPILNLTSAHPAPIDPATLRFASSNADLSRDPPSPCLQVEYAMEAVRKGTLAVGVHFDCVVSAEKNTASSGSRTIVDPDGGRSVRRFRVSP